MKWITIKTYNFEHEAQVEKGKLESEGIKVFLKNELAMQTYNFNAFGSNGIELQVPESDVAKAMACIDHLDNIDISELLPPIQCPHCKSHHIQPKMSKVSSFLHLVFPNLFGSKKFHCFDCQRTFETDETK